MLELNDIVKVSIGIEANSVTTADLKTIAVLSQHTNFDEGELYRIYGSTTEMLDDGFVTTDFAYEAARRIFSQNPRPRNIVVGLVQENEESTPVIDYVYSIQQLQGVTTDWFYLITDASTDADRLAIAQFVETQDLAYFFSESNPDSLVPTNTTNIHYTIGSQALQHSVGMHIKDTNVKAAEAAWVGYFSTFNTGSASWIHKPLATLTPEKFTRTEMSALNANNAHFYTYVGKDPSIEGSGRVAGGEMIHVVLGIIWLQTRLKERLWNVFRTKFRLNYTNATADLFKAEVFAVLSEAVANDILTADDGFTINVPDVNALTSAERATGVMGRITFRARLAGAVLFIDGIEGTVYA